MRAGAVLLCSSVRDAIAHAHTHTRDGRSTVRSFARARSAAPPRLARMKCAGARMRHGCARPRCAKRLTHAAGWRGHPGWSCAASVAAKSTRATAGACIAWMARYGARAAATVAAAAVRPADARDAQSYTFLNSKSEASFRMKRSGRETLWTPLYRRAHKKGITEEAARRRTRRTTRAQRGIQGISLEALLAKRNQKPEVRKAQREQAVAAAKEAAKAKKAVRKAAITTARAAAPSVASREKAPQKIRTAAPRVGGKR